MGPHVVILIDRTSIFQWYMTRLVIKNKHWKDTYHDEIELCAKMDIILGSIVGMFQTIHAVQRESESSIRSLMNFTSQI